MPLPSFFLDHSESMKFEEVIDFFISWTIRCADDIYKTKTPLLNAYSKRILSKLFYDDPDKLENEKVSNIKVWKQWSNVDLWIEFKTESSENINILIIENKMYSSIRTGQLEKYEALVTDYYKDISTNTIKFVLLRPDHTLNTHGNEELFCGEKRYGYYDLEQLQALLTDGKTGNDLFDEFWFNWEEQVQRRYKDVSESQG